MENSNQASPQVPSGLPTPPPMSPQIKAKHNIIPVLIMVGILLALVIGALMMQTVRDGEFALSPKAANMASVGQLAQGGVIAETPVEDLELSLDEQVAAAAEMEREVEAARTAGIIVDSAPSADLFPVSNLPPPSLSSPTAGNSSVNTAGADCTGNKCQFENPLGQSGSLEVFLNKLLDVIILIGSIVVVLSIIMAGLKYVTAQGDEGKISDAHKQLTWTVIGAAILLGAKVIAMIVQNTVKALS